MQLQNCRGIVVFRSGSGAQLKTVIWIRWQEVSGREREKNVPCFPDVMIIYTENCKGTPLYFQNVRDFKVALHRINMESIAI